MSKTKDFKFIDCGVLSDGEIEVVVKETSMPKKKGYVPAYEFEIRLPGNLKPIGRVGLRIGNTRWVTRYGGHIGFGVNEPYRGHRYAVKACNLVKRVALAHGLKTLWIGCYPDNIPSRRTCEILGCELVEIIDLPENSGLYQPGHTQSCRYKWDLES